jgi:hypothetical protein
MSDDKARLRAMQALRKLLPGDDSGKMEERAIKGYIELLETELSREQDWRAEIVKEIHDMHLMLGSAPGEDIFASMRRVLAEYQKLKGQTA